MLACSQAQGGRMERRKVVREKDSASIEAKAMIKAENDTVAAVELSLLDYYDGNKEYNDTVSVKAGVINIPAKANPSTGYKWFETIEVADSAILRLVKVEHPTPKRDPSQPMMVGAPITMTYQFATEKAGSAKIIFDYKRPWEKNKDPETTVVYNITITE